MISKYSKQMQINSNMVIYFTFEYLIWTKRKGHSSYSNWGEEAYLLKRVNIYSADHIDGFTVNWSLNDLFHDLHL